MGVLKSTGGLIELEDDEPVPPGCTLQVREVHGITDEHASMGLMGLFGHGLLLDDPQWWKALHPSQHLASVEVQSNVIRNPDPFYNDA